VIDRSASRKRQSAKRTQSQILQEAERAFVEHGYEVTTVTDIAKALDMSPANVFKHFGSKAQLANRVLESRLLADLEIAGQTIGDRLESSLQQISNVLLDIYRTEPNLLELVRLFMSCTETRDRLRRHVEQQVQLALKSGNRPTFEKAAADVFVATLQSTSVEESDTLLRSRLQSYMELLRTVVSGLSLQPMARQNELSPDDTGVLGSY
jgi:TetR/AcrR family transcriptional repressor of the ameABC operon